MVTPSCTAASTKRNASWRVGGGKQPLNHLDVDCHLGIGDDAALGAGQETEQRAVLARIDGGARR